VFREFCKIADYPVNCLPYYGYDYVERQIRNIQQFYLNPPEFSTDFQFLTPQAMQEWVGRSALDIAAQVSSLRLSI
jgi:hypothetical protein